MAAAAPAPISHNQIGQKLGRKGQETRERIISAMLDLLAKRDGPPVTVSGVAREAQVRPPNVYLYFPDMAELLLAALARVMDTAEAAYLAQLRTPWPDATLHAACLAFLRAHHDFWQRHARLLHMRNAMADAGDLRVLRYRNDVTTPLIALLAAQFGEGESAADVNAASVLLTGVERMATVVTNPQFRIITGNVDEADERAHVHGLIQAQAEVLAAVIANRRAAAR